MAAADEGAGAEGHETIVAVLGFLAGAQGAAFGLAEGGATSAVGVAVAAAAVVAEEAVGAEAERLEVGGEGRYGGQEGDSHYEFFHLIPQIFKLLMIRNSPGG